MNWMQGREEEETMSSPPYHKPEVTLAPMMQTLTMCEALVPNKYISTPATDIVHAVAAFAENAG